MEMTRPRKRSTGGRKTNQKYLSEEIINEILVRLPTKSVFRFSSVCKLWLSLISQSTFKNAHLKHVLSDNNQRKIMFVLDTLPLPTFYLIDQDAELVEKNYNLPLQAPGGIRVIGSCNGLLLVGIRRRFNPIYEQVILWNPLFNAYEKIPFKNLSDDNLYGFDYDFYAQDYKFVSYDRVNGRAEVYNLKSGLLKTLPVELDFSYVNRYQHGIAFKGCIYWIALANGNTEVVLIEFNTRYEEFRMVNLPPEYRAVSILGGAKLSVVAKDSLGIFIYAYRRVSFDLVTMRIEENGGGITWNKVTFQNPPGKVGWPLCMVSNDEILMRFGNRVPKPERTPTDDLFIYNPQKRTITDTGIHRAGDWTVYISYMETLVLPGVAE